MPDTGILERSPSARTRAADAMPGSDWIAEPLVTMFREYRALTARADAIHDDDERDVLTTQAIDVADRMLAMPAEGAAGALAKLWIYVQMTRGRWDVTEDGRWPTIDDKIFASAIADLERLATL